MCEGYRAGDFELVGNPEPASWIIGQVSGSGKVGSLLPSGFAAYARIFHPAYRQDENVTWGEVARANGRVMHPAAQFSSLAGRLTLHGYEQPGLWDTEPDDGSLPADIAARMAAVLARYTATPGRCWFAVWEGWADLSCRSPGQAAFQLPGRRYFLFTGSVAAASRSLTDDIGHRSANLWWPGDRAWCVATEVDLNSTYVGGSGACVAELVATPGLEAARVTASDRISYKSDEINPLPAG